MYYFVYKINFEDGHYYIGKHRTSNLEDEYSGSGHGLKKFKDKNPQIKWTKEILCFCKNKGELAVNESKYIGNLYKTDPLCLNMVAGPTSGFEFTEEHKKYISERTKEGMKKVPKEKLSHQAWNKGRIGVYSEEVIERMKEAANKRAPISEETRRRMSESQKGKKLSEETKQKISEHNPMKNPEIVKKVVEKNTGQKRTEEQRKNISKSLKGKPGHTPWNKGVLMSDDIKKKISTSVKEAMKKVPKEVLSKGRNGKTNWLGNNKTKYGWKINPNTGKREWYKK